MRWSIECIFRDLKENVAFDHYQMRFIKGISRHWHLAFVAYTFLLWVKLNGFFYKISTRKQQTLGDVLRTLRCLNGLCSLQWLQENKQVFKEHLKKHYFMKICKF